MYVKRNYGFWMTVNWSKKPFLYGLLYALMVTTVYIYTGTDISIPWQPIGVIGIAVAFYLGFKNNSSYDRTWEARKIWGAIVNNSRTFSTAVLTFIKTGRPDEPDLKHKLINRHIAWLTALRYQLRLSKEWEHTNERLTGVYVPTICEAYFNRLDEEISNFIGPDELERYKRQTNMAAQLLATQAAAIKELKESQYITELEHFRLHELIGQLYDDQGRCERIKNFPFPRQYASTALWTTYVFAAMIPFGLLSVFSEANWVWLNVPFSAVLIWVFFLTEKIGDYSENPFEGTYNDVPISAISRAIEIDLREMLGDKNIPYPLEPENGFLM
jgi:ion channel-forming bestrophin family protein